MKIPLAFLLLLILPCDYAPAQQPPLRDLADKAGILIGAAVAYEPLMTDSEYATVLAREYNILTAENVMKWQNVNPTEGVYNWGPADAIISFALAHGMKVRGHNLVWHLQVPEWIQHGLFNRDRMIDIMKTHIRDVAGHFRGKIYCWDVVNEAIDDQGALRDSPFLHAIGPDYLDIAYRTAHAADPGAKLIYNDYDAEALGLKSDAVYNLVKGMKERGVPLDGVGLQMHINDTGIDFAGMKKNIERLRALGLDVSVTELDVRLAKPVDSAKLTTQAKVYRQVCDTLFSSQPNAMLVSWGFTDKFSWIPKFFHGFDAGLPFAADYQSKPGRQAIADALSAATVQ